MGGSNPTNLYWVLTLQVTFRRFIQTQILIKLLEAIFYWFPGNLPLKIQSNHVVHILFKMAVLHEHPILLILQYLRPRSKPGHLITFPPPPKNTLKHYTGWKVGREKRGVMFENGLSEVWTQSCRLQEASNSLQYKSNFSQIFWRKLYGGREGKEGFSWDLFSYF